MDKRRKQDTVALRNLWQLCRRSKQRHSSKHKIIFRINIIKPVHLLINHIQNIKGHLNGSRQYDSEKSRRECEILQKSFWL